MNYNAVEFALERAFQSYLEENLSQKIPVRLKREIQEPQYPIIAIGETNAREEPENTATYECYIEITIASDISADSERHESYVGQVMDLIYNTGLMDELNADRADTLSVQRVQKIGRPTSVDEGICRTTQQLQVMCSMAG